MENNGTLDIGRDFDLSTMLNLLDIGISIRETAVDAKRGGEIE